jgi:HAD superfamily hydrolase (TIGR01509 family)
MALSLSLTGLLPAFKNCLFSAEQVTRGKPAPDLFLYAADYFSVDPAHCLVIEDSLIGCEAAKAAGMQLLAFKIEASAPYPDVITDLGALQHILG